jgi:hypothetical protein
LGCLVESPVDPFNWSAHRGGFGLRVPPSRRALREFFTACRDYAVGLCRPGFPVSHARSLQ